MSRLGVYWSVMHRRPQDYEYFRHMQPSVFKIMDGGDGDYKWAKDNLPNSLIIARDWALSEQHDDMLRDPKGTGQRHAQEWDRHQSTLGFDRAKTLILGINEPRVWDAGVPEALRLYTIALCDEAARLGLRVGAMQLSVGWPDNTGPDTPPNWTPFNSVEDAIKRGNHALVLHEYWADNGPGENWGWWAGRSLKCPWNVPIVIGECGIDMYVKDGSVERHKRGWFGRMEPRRYARELADYVGRMSADSRFVGCCVFAADFADDDWYSFDVEPAYKAIMETPIVERPKAETRLPTVSTGPTPVTPTQPTPPMPTGIIEPRVAQAILKIESGGRSHGTDGRVIIRFEAHIFKTYLGNDALWAEYFRADANRPWINQEWRRSPGDPWRTLHTGKQADEWDVFQFAATLHREAAYKSISMGAAQIMGFNHARVGYPSAQGMYAAFEDANMQTLGFINFCLSDTGLFEAIKRKDWREIAKRYNGPGQVDYYAKLLEDAYKAVGG